MLTPARRPCLAILSVACALVFVTISPAVAGEDPGPFSTINCGGAGEVGCDLKAEAPGRRRDAAPGRRSDSVSCPGSALTPLCPAGGGVLGRAGVTTGGSPAEVGALAVARLDLPAPVVAVSPSLKVTQLVGVPTWLWIPGSWWRGRSATVQVPGLAVTATAVPTRVVWQTGDGLQVVCAGPGTPWSAARGTNGGSPDCGHVYTRPSSSQPSGIYRLVTTVIWQITWAGGGQTGTEPALGTSTVTALRVGESSALLTTR